MRLAALAKTAQEQASRRLRDILAAIAGVSAPEEVRWLQVSKAALAGAVAWELALHGVGSKAPVLAPLTAMLTVQVTVYESVRTAFQRTTGVVAGVLLAYLLARLLGLHSWTILLVIFLGLAVGQVLALGSQGSSQVPISALLVMAVGAASAGTRNYATVRVLDTVIGAGVGVAVAFLVVPPVHLPHSGRALRRLAEEQANLLGTIAESLRGGWPGSDTGRRLEAARSLDRLLDRARTELERGDQSVRWNPRSRRTRQAIGTYRAELRALEHTNLQIRGIARTLADVSRDMRDDPDPWRLPDELRGRLVGLLLDAKAALCAFGRVAVDDEGAVASPEAVETLQEQVQRAQSSARSAIRAARRAQLPEAGWLVLGSVLTDLQRLVNELEVRRSAALDLTIVPKLRIPRPRRAPRLRKRVWRQRLRERTPELLRRS